MHGVVHGPQAHLHSQSHVHHELASCSRPCTITMLQRIAHADEEGDGGWLASLFSSHDGNDSDCRLFDQASQGHAAPVHVPC
jgi:hypothetical protein